MWKCESIRPGTIVQSTEINRLDVGGSRDPVVRTDIDDPIALNHDAAVLDRRGTTAVHHADVLEDQPSGRRLGQPGAIAVAIRISGHRRKCLRIGTDCSL